MQWKNLLPIITRLPNSLEKSKCSQFRDLPRNNWVTVLGFLFEVVGCG